ncbi:MAG TPA: dipeptide ABC transporter ATP-binding protein [Planctomycetota bacterium]|nr:dipeptide ABC transporter ATP-binding protein [Planctomycetota bacterium]
MDGKLLVVRDLVKHFPVRRGVFGRVRGQVKAVDGVSFGLEEGRTLGLVGESGCGKTTTGRVILSLLSPTSGSVWFDGIDLSVLSPGELRAMRRQMQLIFQDPFGSLNPRMTVLGIVGEALGIHGEARGRERERRVAELLERVGLDRRHIRRYPHEFSGGQRQRIGIARALALRPRFIVCDEPVSALDVSIQAQIINLLDDLQKDFQLTYLFIAHDLSVVEHVSDDVAVMYLGKIVEKAPGPDIYREPLHPYTMALLSAVPTADPSARKEEIILEGDVPSPLNPPSGCCFHTRCRYMEQRCKERVPDLREIAPGHFTACIRAEEIRTGTPPTR